MEKLGWVCERGGGGKRDLRDDLVEAPELERAAHGLRVGLAVELERRRAQLVVHERLGSEREKTHI